MKKTVVALIALLMCFSFCCAFVNAESSEIDTESQLHKKSVLFVGDSIGEASCEWGTETVGWAGRIMAWNEMSGYNLAKSGASISNCRGMNTVLHQLKSQKKNKYDYLIIEGGGNDAWDSAPIGEITKGFDGPFDLTTFAGALEETFKFAKENYKESQIGFIVTFQMPNATAGRLSDMSGYFSLAKEICDKWEIPYLDLYFDEDFNKNIMKTHTDACLYDTIHPNTAGYNVLSPIINDWMKTLGVEEEVSEPEVSSEAELSLNSSLSDEGDENGGISAKIVALIVAAVAVAVVSAVVIAKNAKKK